MASDMGGMVASGRPVIHPSSGFPSLPNNLSTSDIPGLPSYTQDPFFFASTLRLHGGKANGTTTFTDTSTKSQTVTTVGNASYTTSRSVFDGSSIRFDATTGALTVPSGTNLAVNAPFSIECWINLPVSNSANGQLVVLEGQAGAHIGHRFGIDSTTGVINFLLVKASAPTTSFFQLLGSTSIPLNTWTHMAASLDSNFTARVFVNGKLDGVLQMSSDIVAPVGGRVMNIGQYYDGTLHINAYIQEFIFTNGVCKYCAPFVKPVRAFSDF